MKISDAHAKEIGTIRKSKTAKKNINEKEFYIFAAINN